MLDEYTLLLILLQRKKLIDGRSLLTVRCTCTIYFCQEKSSSCVHAIGNSFQMCERNTTLTYHVGGSLEGRARSQDFDGCRTGTGSDCCRRMCLSM